MVLRTIRESFGRFIAIFAITGLGVGFLVGLLCTAPDMRQSVDTYYDEGHLFDLNVKSAKGLTEDDRTTVEQMADVERVTPSYQKDLLVQTEDGEQATARLHVLDFSAEGEEAVNRPALKEGRFPEKAGECAAISDSAFGAGAGLKIGDTVCLEPEEDDEELFRERELTVVGLASSPLYMAAEQESTSVGSGTVALFFYVDRSEIDTDIFTDFHISLTDCVPLDTFGSAYQEAVDGQAETLKALGRERALIRDQEIYDEAMDEIREAEDEYREKRADAEQELFDAKQELTGAEKKIRDGEKELADGKEELADGKRELDKAEKQLSDAKKELDKNKSQVDKARKTIKENGGKIKEAKKAVETFDGQKKAWEKGVKELAKAKKTLDAGRKKLAEGRAEYEAAKAEADPQIEKARQELTAAEKQISQGGQELAAREKELAGHKASLDAMEKDAQAVAAAIEAGQPVTEEMRQLLAGYQTGKAAYEQGMAALEEARRTLAGARSQYEAGKAELEAQEKALAGAKAELDASEKQLDAGEKEYKKNKKTLDDAGEKIEEAEPKIKEARGQIAQWDKNYPAMKKGIADYEKGLRQYRSGKAAFDKHKKEYEDGLAELEENERKLKDAREEYEDGLKEYEDAEAEAEQEFADAETEIADARQKVEELEPGEWYVLDRNTNPSYVSFDNNSEKVSAIARVFPVFFFLVAALVALTTMTRMVEEERGEIGTLKALGYGKGTILAKYLLYAGSAGILGSIAGILVGQWLFPTVIWNAYSIMYYYPGFHTVFRGIYAIPSAAVSVLGVLGATYWACAGILREKPARLMLPRAPKAGKRIWLEYVTPLWRSMKFTYKVTARNLFRYKKRLFMTLVGIAGCTALLLAGFGIRDAIGDIVGIQYEELQQYHLTVDLEDKASQESIQGLHVYLDGHARGYAAVHSEQVSILQGRRKEDTVLVVPESAKEYRNFMVFRDRRSGREIPFDASSVLLTEKLADTLGVSVGDTFTLEDSDDARAELTVTGITENYIRSFVYVGAAAHEEAFGKTVEYRTRHVIYPVEPEEEERVVTELLAMADVSSAQYNSTVIATFENMLGKVDYIVVVLIICAGLLAFVVLYNLTNINIGEREKEIATIKVLGFYPGEVNAYIYRETVVLSIMGAVVGLVGGIYLNRFIVVTAEVSNIMFGRRIYPMSFVYAFVITMVFTGLVCLVMSGKLKKISMVESMKSVD